LIPTPRPTESAARPARPHSTPAPFHRYPSARGGVIAFVALVCLLVVALSVREIWDSRAADIRNSQRQTTNLAQSLGQQVTDTFQTVDSVLLDLSERVETEGTAPAELRRLRAVINARVRELPVIHNLFIISANAARLVDANPPKDATSRDRMYFKYHRTHADRRTYIGPAVRSRTDGTWVITASRRLNHPDGSFAGVAVAAIQVKYFDHLYQNVDVGTFGIIGLSLADGTLLVRKPFLRASIGKSLAKAPFFSKARLQMSSGTYESRSVIDGISRFFAYRRVDRYPLRIVVGMSQDEVLTEWRWEMWINLAEVAATLAIVLLLGTYLVRQIRRREAVEGELARLALVDGLTGLGNRRRFDEVLDREWRRAVRARTSFAFLMIDVDEFKPYNDHYGHRAGDRALKAIAACIATAVARSDDLSARYGGEEFAVLLPATDAVGAYQVAETIRGGVAGLRIVHAASPLGFVTVSVGAAAERPVRGSHPGAVVDAADSALYDAKRAGRNRSAIVRELETTAAG